MPEALPLERPMTEKTPDRFLPYIVIGTIYDSDADRINVQPKEWKLIGLHLPVDLRYGPRCNLERRASVKYRYLEAMGRIAKIIDDSQAPVFVFGELNETLSDNSLENARSILKYTGVHTVLLVTAELLPDTSPNRFNIIIYSYSEAGLLAIARARYKTRDMIYDTLIQHARSLPGPQF